MECLIAIACGVVVGIFGLVLKGARLGKGAMLLIILLAIAVLVVSLALSSGQ